LLFRSEYTRDIASDRESWEQGKGSRMGGAKGVPFATHKLLERGVERMAWMGCSKGWLAASKVYELSNDRVGRCRKR